MGKLLIYAGIVLIAAGFIVSMLEKTSLPLGRLPGDVVWRGRYGTVYVPIVTCFVLSVVLSVLWWLFNRR